MMKSVEASDAGSDGEKSGQEGKQEKSERGSKNAKKGDNLAEGKASAKESMDLDCFAAEKVKVSSAGEQPGSASPSGLLSGAVGLSIDLTAKTNLMMAEVEQQECQGSVCEAVKSRIVRRFEQPGDASFKGLLRGAVESSTDLIAKATVMTADLGQQAGQGRVFETEEGRISSQGEQPGDSTVSAIESNAGEQPGSATFNACAFRFTP